VDDCCIDDAPVDVGEGRGACGGTSRHPSGVCDAGVSGGGGVYTDWRMQDTGGRTDRARTSAEECRWGRPATNKQDKFNN